MSAVSVSSFQPSSTRRGGGSRSEARPFRRSSNNSLSQREKLSHVLSPAASTRETPLLFSVAPEHGNRPTTSSDRMDRMFAARDPTGLPSYVGNRSASSSGSRSAHCRSPVSLNSGSTADTVFTSSKSFDVQTDAAHMVRKDPEWIWTFDTNLYIASALTLSLISSSSFQVRLSPIGHTFVQYRVRGNPFVSKVSECVPTRCHSHSRFRTGYLNMNRNMKPANGTGNHLLDPSID
jgi:hypothetical protein